MLHRLWAQTLHVLQCCLQGGGHCSLILQTLCPVGWVMAKTVLPGPGLRRYYWSWPDKRVGEWTLEGAGFKGQETAQLCSCGLCTSKSLLAK